MGYSPGGRKELDTTLHLSTHTIHSLWQLFLNCCQYLSNGRHFGHNALNVNLVFGTTPSALYVFSVAHRRILYTGKNIIYDQFNCVQLFVTPWTVGFPVHHQLLELAQTHVHRFSDAIQPSHPLSSPSPPAFNLSQHQGLFQGVTSSHQVAKVQELQLHSFQ